MSEVAIHERYSGFEELPDPEQLFALTATAIEVARRQYKFRPGRNFRNARFLSIIPVESAGIDVFDDTHFHTLEHKLIGHIRRLPITRECPRRTWSLRLGESLWASHSDTPERGSMRSIYRFEWSESSVRRAERQTMHGTAPDPRDLYDTWENFSLGDDAVAILDAETDMRTVTAADCRLLHQNIGRLCEQSMSA